ncbi:MAG: hypothetical protein U1F43_36440 [Myxococcota bacterium]
MTRLSAPRPSPDRAPAPATRAPVQREASSTPAAASAPDGGAAPGAPGMAQPPSRDLRAASTAAATSIAEQRAGSGGGDWSDPFGSMINRRILHAPDAAALATVRAAVEAAVAGDLHPLAAMMGGHTPRLTPPELARLLRHCDARARVLAQETQAGAAGPAAASAPPAPPAPTQAGAAPQVVAGPATPSAGPAPIPSAGSAAPSPMSGASAELEAAHTAPPPRPDPAVVGASFDRQAPALERAFAEVRAGGAVAMLRAAVLREAQNLTPENPRADVAVGATTAGETHELQRGGRLSTSGGERGTLGMVQLARGADGQITVSARAVPVEENTLVVVLGRYSFQTQRRETAEDTRLERGTLRSELGRLAGRPPATPAAQP